MVVERPEADGRDRDPESGASGGTGWNGTLPARQMPWLLNRRYGLSLPTAASGIGRAIGFTDWLYGP